MNTDNNTPYSVSRGKDFFDWNDFLNKENYTLDELEKAYNLASNQVTCACGNQCNAIPRDNYGRPLDNLLDNLGTEFMYAIYLMYFYSKEEDTHGLFLQAKTTAIHVLAKIEERSSYLINEINSK